MTHALALNYTLVIVALCGGLFLTMVAVAVLGHRLAIRRMRVSGDQPSEMGTVSAAVFALFGLLVAFNFSGGFSRLETRRALLVDEANAIGTAYLRLDLLPADAQAPLRALFRDYARSRAALYPLLADPPAAYAELARAAKMQAEIWQRAVAATEGAEYRPMRILVLPALNEMIDITTKRYVAIHTHAPAVIYVTLFLIAILCGWLAGYSAAPGRPLDWVYVVGFALVTSLTLYVMLDVEMPRYGLVRLDQANQALVDLAESMK